MLQGPRAGARTGSPYRERCDQREPGRKKADRSTDAGYAASVSGQGDEMPEQEGRSHEWATKIDELVRRTESIADPNARRVALDLLRVVMEFHAAALDRIMEIVSETGDGPSTIDSIAKDDLAASILLLQGLHPDNFETRVRSAVDKLLLRFSPRGARLMLVGIEGCFPVWSTATLGA